MRSFLIAAAAVGWALLAVGTAFAADADKPGSAEAALRSSSAREVSAFLAADTRAMDGLWADGMVVTNPLNRFVTKPQVLGMVGSGMLRFTGYERTIEYVRLYGDTGIVAGAETVLWAGKMPLAGKVSHLRFTAVWVKDGGRWREVARHANIVPDS